MPLQTNSLLQGKKHTTWKNSDLLFLKFRSLGKEELFLIDTKSALSDFGITPEEYEDILKKCSDKVDGVSDLDWQDIVDHYKLNIHYDSLRKAQSMLPFGGVFVRQYYIDKFLNSAANNDYHTIDSQRQELEKEKIKFRDERNEYTRIIREQSRRESFLDLVKRVMAESITPIVSDPDLTDNKNDSGIDIDKTGDDMIVCLSDIHAGIAVDNFLNEYDIGVLAIRLHTYSEKIKEIQKSSRCKICYLCLGGDMISGLIHTNLRLQNNENVIKQLKIVSTLISNFVNDLRNSFDNIVIVSVSGNHSRLSPSKEDQLRGEELDSLIPFYLNIKFENAQDVVVCEENLDDSICAFKTKTGNLFYCVHGDKDTMSNVAKDLTMMTGVKPDAIIIGHRHHNAMETIHGVKIIQCGSVVGTDDYCIDHRISGIPEQIVIISSESNPVKCLYNIDLS